MKIKTVLEYGGGIGEFSLVCSDNKLDIYYYDLDGLLKEYAKWRFKKHAANIKVMNEEPLNKKWDAVNIMDVLEHLEKPEDVIKKLAENVKFIFCNPQSIQYNVIYPQHISKFDLSPYFEHKGLHLWTNKKLI